MSSKAPELKHSPKEIEGEKAKHSWNTICKEIHKPASSITAEVVVSEMAFLMDHVDSLSKTEQKKVRNAFLTLRKNDTTFIHSRLKPALLERIHAETGKSKRYQNQKTAEMLGLLGNWFGFGVDKDVSQALGAVSNVKRRHIQTAVGAAVAAGLGVAIDSSSGKEAIKPILRAGRALTYLAQASITESDLSAPQPKPASLQKKEPSPIPNKPPTLTLPASPEAKTPPTSTMEATRPPIPTSTLEPTREPTLTPPPTQDSEPTDEPEAETQEEVAPPENMVEIGSQNLAEFFLGQWISELKGKGLTLWENDPSYQERVPLENAESDCVTMVYLGTDNERSRDGHATNAARSDVIIIERFDPHTFKSAFISVNRDLLAPEGGEFGMLRINELSTLPLRGVNSYPLLQRMFETMSGWRIDGIIQTNIDFINGYDEYYDVAKKEGQPGKNSVIDRWVPEGLEVNPPNTIDDPLYPKGFGVQHVHFNPGPQILHGQDLVKYARARKGEGNNDYERSTRQREVGFKLLRSMASKIADDLEQGNTEHLDVTLDVLREQEEVGNFFQYDVDVTSILQGIKDSVSEIQSMPNGDTIIAKLAGNSMGNIARLLGAEASKKTGLPFGDPDSGFVSFGLSNSNGFLEDHPNTAGAAITRLRGSGPSIFKKTAQGNFMEYWRTLRDKAAELDAA